MSHIQTHTQRYWDCMPKIDSPVKPFLSSCLVRQNKLIKHKRPSAGLPSAGQQHTSERSISNKDSGSDTADHYTPSAEKGSRRKQKAIWAPQPEFGGKCNLKKKTDERGEEKVKAPYISDASSYQYASNNETIWQQEEGGKKMWSWWVNARLSYLWIRRENQECLKKHYNWNKQTKNHQWIVSEIWHSSKCPSRQRTKSRFILPEFLLEMYLTSSQAPEATRRKKRDRVFISLLPTWKNSTQQGQNVRKNIAGIAGILQHKHYHVIFWSNSDCCYLGSGYKQHFHQSSHFLWWFSKSSSTHRKLWAPIGKSDYEIIMSGQSREKPKW